MVREKTHDNCGVANNEMKTMQDCSVFSSRSFIALIYGIVNFCVGPILLSVTAIIHIVPV